MNYCWMLKYYECSVIGWSKLIIYNDRSRRLAEFMYLHMIDYDSSKKKKKKKKVWWYEISRKTCLAIYWISVANFGVYTFVCWNQANCCNDARSNSKSLAWSGIARKFHTFHMVTWIPTYTNQHYDVEEVTPLACILFHIFSFGVRMFRLNVVWMYSCRSSTN